MTMHTTTIASERRFDRASWLTLAFVLGFALFCAVVSALVMRLPSDGCVMSDYSTGATTPQIVDTCYGDWPTPLRHGDKLLAFGPVTISDDLTVLWGAQMPPPGWGVGATIEYTVQRGEATIRLPVPIDQLNWGGVARVFAYTLGFGPDSVAAWIKEYLLFLSVVVIFALAPRNAAARLLLVSFGTSSAVTGLGWGGSPVSSAFHFTHGALYYGTHMIMFFWVWLFWPSLLLLVLSFPRRVWSVARWPRGAPALLYGVPTAVVLMTPMLGNGILPLAVVLVVQFALILGSLIAVTTHTFRRVRDRVVRAQTGWLLLGLASYIVPSLIDYSLLLFVPQTWESVDQRLRVVLLTITTGIGFPLCLGIAILRYRLFDIDIIIRRTLVYAALTLILGATYFVGVVALQALFVRLMGQENTLAVVASTLAIAALFGPVRRRVQQVIDRRFFRRKYDARLVLDQFALRAQQQADIDALAGDIVGVVDETLQPERTRLWLVQPGQFSTRHSR